ncbi:MAG: hypothetical protein MUO82_08845 [Candidatus Thermoplasmatota archaeon]|nr:hypothetical protein [Candidatus Thermoplasmatota archaeon]
MSEQNPDFKQPPWVYGPKETMDWIEATHPSKKREKKSQKKSSDNILINPHIHLDLDVEQTKINPPTVFSRLSSKITGNTFVEEHLDLLSTSEIILRGLAKVKFHHTVKILIDKKIRYDNPEIISDLKKSIDIFKGISIDTNQSKLFEITAVLDDVHRCVVEIKIKKVHWRKEHTIDIFMKGIIKEESYHTFLNYLNEKLKVKKTILK